MTMYIITDLPLSMGDLIFFLFFSFVNAMQWASLRTSIESCDTPDSENKTSLGALLKQMWRDSCTTCFYFSKNLEFRSQNDTNWHWMDLLFLGTTINYYIQIETLVLNVLKKAYLPFKFSLHTQTSDGVM